MQGRRVRPMAKGAVETIVFRCLLCDVRKCKCGHAVQSITTNKCPSCGCGLR